MEKFVTDLDKLLDEFESEDISSNTMYEFSDSSGYNSLKTSTELYPQELSIERTISQFENINEIIELPTPTCTETSIIDSVAEEFCNFENITPNKFETLDSSNKTGSVEDVNIKLVEENLDKPNGNMSNTSEISSAVIPDNTHNQLADQSIQSSTLSHVPPKKKLRPNSLFNVTDISLNQDCGFSENIFINPPEIITNEFINENTVPPTQIEVSGNSSTCKKTVKRPLSLNIISPENNLNNIPDIQVCNDNSIQTMETISGFEQESGKESSQSIESEVDFMDRNEVQDSNAWQGIPIEELGKKEPQWIKDNITNNCMQCQLPFTIFRRRHHCRACGRLLCGKCCCWRMQLQFSNKFFPKDRVCAVCFQYLIRIEVSKKKSQNSAISNVQMRNSALKSSSRPQSLAVSPFSNSDTSISNSINNFNMPKSVIFFDGIRPGGDLRETEKSRIITPTKYQSPTQKKNPNSNIGTMLTCREPSLIAQENFYTSLPPSVLEYKTKLITNENSESIAQQIKSVDNHSLILAVTRNLHIQVEIIQLTYCTCTINHTHNESIHQECDYECIECWYFASIGLETIGCEEVVIILKKLPNENSPPIEIFQYYFQVYQKAFKNETKNDDMEMSVVLFPESNQNLKEWAGIFHIRSTFQCLDKLPLPCSSFLFGILVHRWELPWANILPLRLLLALGNQSRFYPCSIISDRDRPSVYFEISQTILQIINPIFSFPNNFEEGFINPSSLPTVPGMWIHLLASKETIVQIPKLSYQKLLDILYCHQSERDTLALVACFSREADSHLVCCQNEETCKYYSGAISIQNTERTVTGATMIIFAPCENNNEHGASIVEDVLVVRLSFIQLSCVINSLKTMSNLILQWDSYAVAEENNKLESSIHNYNPFVSRSFIKIVWTDNHQYSEMASIERPSLVTDETIQATFRSSIFDENRILKSHRVPYSLQDLSVGGNDTNNDNLKLVWTRFHYYLSVNSLNNSLNDDPMDIEDIIRKIAICFSESINPYLEILRELSFVNIGLRITINNENVNFSVGCSKKHTYSALTPDQSPTGDPDSNQNSYVCSKIGNSRKFNSLSLGTLPDICIDSLNDILVPFLYSQISQLRNGSIISELEFHIID